MVTTVPEVSTYPNVSQPSEDAGGQLTAEARSVFAPRILEIKESYRLRQDMVRAEVALTLRISAQRCRMLCGALDTGDPHHCGRTGRYGVRPGQGQSPSDVHCPNVLPDTDGDDQRPIDTQAMTVIPTRRGGGRAAIATHSTAAPTPDDLAAVAFVAMPFYAALKPLHTGKLMHERYLTKQVKQLPAWPWVASIKGFGPVNFGAIVGEAGDLSRYPNPAKLWKRMGLAVINGGRQRKVLGLEAIEHGYNPSRRSVMWVTGDCLIKKQNAYRDYYLTEKDRQREKSPDDPPIAHHLRAKRHMEKRLLRDLWRAWRDA